MNAGSTSPGSATPAAASASHGPAEPERMARAMVHACQSVLAHRARSVPATMRSSGPDPSAVASSPKPRTCTLRPVAAQAAETSSPASTGNPASRAAARTAESCVRLSWSVTAIPARPAARARPISSSGENEPSENVEWL